MTGTLQLTYHARSAFLRSVLPIEIRDQRHVLIRKFPAAESARMSLEAGLYTVSAILEDGRRETKLVTIESGKPTHVTFGTPPGLESFSGTEAGTPMQALFPDANFLDVAFRPHTLPASQSSLIAASPGLRVDRLDDLRWRTTVEKGAATSAWVMLSDGDERLWTGLPLDDFGEDGGTCTLKIAPASLTTPFAVTIALSPDRIVASALMNMAESGRIGDALALADADHAIELLERKYSDPVAAAYGGLLLHRFKLLQKHAAWVENLARDFAWLADGRVLLAATLVHNPDRAERERGLGVLLEATENPTMVFSDTFSLALSLLRRWPDADLAPACAARLEALAPLVACFDFDAPYATMRWTEAKDPEPLEVMGTRSKLLQVPAAPPTSTAPVMELRMLPARQGDAIWIRWPDGARTRQMLIDMGTQGVGKELRDKLAALPEEEREFELLVITHIDADHIGGAMTCLLDDLPKGIVFRDIWFNGLNHLGHERVRTLEEMGGVQGKRLMDWLAGKSWNRAFGGQRICRAPGEPLPRITLPGGVSLVVLGPTPKRLAALEPIWNTQLAAALRKKLEREGRDGAVGLEAMGRTRPTKPALPDRATLEALAAGARGQDRSPPNGTSIALLLEHQGRRLLLAGDAYAGDLVEGLACVDHGAKVKLDAFKVPHHGSRENLTRELVEAVECPLWLVSTDGTQFFHPDADAIACVLAYAGSNPELAFNQRSDFTAWWDDDEWKQRFGYTTRYGDDQGLVLRLPSLPREDPATL